MCAKKRNGSLFSSFFTFVLFILFLISLTVNVYLIGVHFSQQKKIDQLQKLTIDQKSKISQLEKEIGNIKIEELIKQKKK